jgi:hypothetical protein
VNSELHCHTTASDGLHSPSEVVDLARRRDVSILAITDHDTIAGHQEAMQAGEQLGVKVIPGMEISSLSSQGEVHVLGYGVTPTDSTTIERIASLRDVREARAKGILNKLERLGISLSFDQVKAFAGDGMIGRPHVARALVKSGFVANEQEAFDKYLAEGGPAFVAHSGLTPAEAVQLTQAAGGVAVLAHPGLYAGDLTKLLDELIAAGLDGIEVFYPWHSPEQIRCYAAFARSHGLLVTGGSDFHGARGDAELSLGSVKVPREDIEALEAKLRQNSRRATVNS